jgi:predicted O-linked N-acetylglucosamine transferase (SPINDLY family)/cytochrome c-type biogenesis protein CcmH/NrfG
MPNPGYRDTLRTAFSLHQAGKLDKAAELYRQILSSDARNSYALHYLGLIEVTIGNFQQAKSLLQRSLSIEPQNVHFMENYATVLFQAGDHRSALDVSMRGLSVTPGNVGLLYIRAISLFKLGRLQESLAEFDKLLLVAPGHVAAINERGAVLAEMKNFEAALAGLAKALALQPQYAEVHLNIGNVHGARKSYGDALAAYDRAVALKPELFDAWLGRGNVLAQLQRCDDALLAYDRALALKPDFVDAWLGRGHVCFDLRHYRQALAAYDKAHSLKPDSAEAHLGRGNALYGIWRYDDALAAYERAAALKPDFVEAWIGRGNALRSTNRPGDALSAYDRALALDAGSDVAWAGRAQALFDANRITEALDAYDKALAIEPNSPDVVSSRIFVHELTPETGFQEQQKARKEWWSTLATAMGDRPPMHHGNTRDPTRRLRIGYVSADFRNHSAAVAFRPMLLHHDKTEFEIVCYSCSPVADDVTADFRRAADRWCDAAQLSDDELCQKINDDEIDILVDLSGHTAGHRLAVFARKPAPVQVSAGATGTGLPAIDYLFSDPVICPPAVRHLFAEKIFDLPCIMTIEPLPYRLPISDPPMLSRGYATFGVFNRVSKISDRAVALWSRILRAIPRSQILIKHYALDDASVRTEQLEKFAAHEVPAERIVLLGSTSREEHLAAFKDVDISLDPFPQNGGISTFESLQMGVPVVALLGNSMTSRTAGAILASLGMPDWVANTADEYLDIAVKFASMPDRLKTLRHALPGMVASSTVGDGATFTKAVEAAYRTMWTDYCRGVAV